MLGSGLKTGEIGEVNQAQHRDEDAKDQHKPPRHAQGAIGVPGLAGFPIGIGRQRQAGSKDGQGEDPVEKYGAGSASVWMASLRVSACGVLAQKWGRRASP